MRINQEKLKAGQAYRNLDFVVCSQLGNLVFRSQFHVNFKTYIEKSGLKMIRFHDLRHTHATLLLKQGVHPKIVSERLGHKAVFITLNKYSHILPGVQEEAVKTLGKASSDSQWLQINKKRGSLLYRNRVFYFLNISKETYTDRVPIDGLACGTYLNLSYCFIWYRKS